MTSLGAMLYGLHQPVVAAGGYWPMEDTFDHSQCDPSVFCRNPLHPGPCKGWKKKLGVIAPGALTAIEKAHKEKVAIKRAARVAAKSHAEKIVATGPEAHLAHPLTAKKKTLKHANVIMGDTEEKAGSKSGKAILNKTEIKRYSQLKGAQVAQIAASRGYTSDEKKYAAYAQGKISEALAKDNLEGGEKNYRHALDSIGGALSSSFAQKHCGAGTDDGDCDGIAFEALLQKHADLLAGALVTGNTDKLDEFEAGVKKAGTSDGLKAYLAKQGVDMKAIEAGLDEDGGEAGPPSMGTPELHAKAKKASLAFQKMAKAVNGKSLSTTEQEQHEAQMVPVLESDPHKFDKHAESLAQGAHLAKKVKDATGVTLGPAEKNKLEKELKAALAGEGDQATPLMDAVNKALAGNDPEGADLKDAFGIDYGDIVKKAPEKPAPKPEPEAPAAPSKAKEGFEKGEKTKMDNLAKIAADQDKANAGAAAIAKLAEMTTGKKLNDKGHGMLVQGIAKHQSSGLAEADSASTLEKQIDVGVEKIAAKTKHLTGQELSPDQQEALAKELKDALNGKGDGKTPLLDVIQKSWTDSAKGLHGPGGDPDVKGTELADALHSGTNGAIMQALVDHPDQWEKLSPALQSVAAQKLHTEKIMGSNAASFLIDKHNIPEPKAENLPEPPKAPEVPTPAVSQIGDNAVTLNVLQQEAVDLATGAKSGTAKMHLATFEKLTPEEFGQLSPTSQKLIMTKLDAAHAKFVDPKKKAAVQAVKDKLSVGVGGGAGAGGSGVPSAPSPAVTAPKTSAAKGQAAADFVAESHELIGQKPGDESLKATAQVIGNILENSPNDPVLQDLADNYTDTLLSAEQFGLPNSEVAVFAEPLAADVHELLKASGAPTPVYDAWKYAVQAKGTPGAHAALVELDKQAIDWHAKNKVSIATEIEEPDALQELMDNVKTADEHVAEWTDSFNKLRALATGQPTGPAASNGAKSILEDGFAKEGMEGFNGPGGTAEVMGRALASLHLKRAFADAGISEETVQGWKSSGAYEEMLHAVGAGYQSALAAKKDVPEGIAAELDDVVSEANAASDTLQTANGWAADSQALKDFKKSVFHAALQAKIKGASPAGAGGTSTAPNPAVTTAPPAAPSVPNLAKVDIPHVEETPEGEEPVLGQGDGIGHISAAGKKKFGVTFHKLPVGTSSSDPVENVYDNLLAVAGWYGSDPDFGGPISILQAAQMLDEFKANKYGSANKNLIEKKLISWLGTTAGKEYAAHYTEPSAEIIGHIQHPEKALPQEKVVILAPGLKVQELAGGPGPYDPSLKADDFKGLTKGQARASQDAYMAASGEKWTQGQQAALKAYTGSAYMEINDYLRGVTTNPSATVIDRAKKIQAGMRPMQENQLIVRGSSYKVFPEGFRNIEGVKKLIGQEIGDEGFVSATVGGETGSFNKKIKLYIEAPIGTMAAHVQHISSHPKENETILAAGTRYRIVSVDESGPQPIVRVRVIS